jgi:hypothetical protein
MERKPDWSRALPELVTLGRRTARTLGDVSAFLLSLPDERATKAACTTVARVAMEAANGGDVGRLAVLCAIPNPQSKAGPGVRRYPRRGACFKIAGRATPPPRRA